MIVLSCLILLLGVQDPDPASFREFVRTWCLECHQEPRAKADLDLSVLLDRMDSGEVPDSLFRTLARLERRDMPPPDFDRPSDAEYHAIVTDLHETIRRHEELESRRPRGTIARRLNRHEFANTVRDLLEIDFAAEDRLPVDEIANGFDNSGDVLSVSPLLLEKYFSIAELVAARSFPLPGIVDSLVVGLEGRELRPSGRVQLRRDGWWMSSRATVRGEFTVDHQEELVFLVVCVPVKNTMEFGQLDFLPIQGGNNSGGPIFRQLVKTGA